MTLFFDNIILFLNVLEQFAIRVTIFDVDIEDIIKYVNKVYYGDIDDYIKGLMKNESIKHSQINPHLIVKDSLKQLDQKIINNILFEKLEYKYNVQNNFQFIY